MPGVNEGGIRVEGSLVHLDAGPARLLAQLRDAAAATYVTALAADGTSRHERLPRAVRRSRYQLAGRSVEATPAAAFVAVTTEAERLIVAALEGEVVVVSSSGNRTAVAAHETLVSEAPDAEPRVVATSELAGDDRVAVDAAVSEASAALIQPMPEVEPAAPVEPPAPVEPAEAPRPEAEAVPAEELAAAAGTADVDEAITEIAEEEKVERRGVAAGLAIGAVVAAAALVTAFLVLPDGEETAGPGATTTAAPRTTAEAATTTEAATTATSPAPTTTAQPVANYDVRPEACRQSGDTVTLTGEIANNADGAWQFTISAVFRDAEGRVLDRGRTEVGPVAPGATETFAVTGNAPRSAAGCDIDDVETAPAG